MSYIGGKDGFEWRIKFPADHICPGNMFEEWMNFDWISISCPAPQSLTDLSFQQFPDKEYINN